MRKARTPEARLDALIARLDKRIEMLLKDVDVDAMSGDVRESLAIKHLTLQLRVMMFRAQLDDGRNSDASADEKLAQVLGFRLLRPGQPPTSEEDVG